MDRNGQYLFGLKVSDKARAAGYFRDCYNDRGLFAVMSANLDKEFSWWQTVGRKDLSFTEDGELTLKGAKQWRAELAPDIERFVALDELYEGQAKTSRKLSPPQTQKYRDWATGLLTFLDLAISKKSSIIFSV